MASERVRRRLPTRTSEISAIHPLITNGPVVYATYTHMTPRLHWHVEPKKSAHPSKSVAVPAPVSAPITVPTKTPAPVHVAANKPAAINPIIFIVKSKAKSVEKPKRKAHVRQGVKPAMIANDPPMADPKSDPPIMVSSSAQRSQSVEHENRPSPTGGSTTEKMSISPIDNSWISSDTPFFKGSYYPHTGHQAHIPHKAHQSHKHHIHNPTKYITIKNN